MRFLWALALFAAVFSLSQAQKPSAADMKERKELAQLEKARNTLQAAYEKHPSDAKAKSWYVKANDKLAYATMNADSLSPKEKYTKALRLYRKSLKAEPNDKDAAQWVKTIEGIYRQMGKPIPK